MYIIFIVQISFLHPLQASEITTNIQPGQMLFLFIQLLFHTDKD